MCDDGTAEEALTILERFTGREGESSVPASVWNELRRQAQSYGSVNQPVISCRNCIIGNNETALQAAIDRANRLGYEVRSLGSDRQGVAREIGVELAKLSQNAGSTSQPVCWIGGGEPVVQLAPSSRPRKGGRNQEVALAALCHLWNRNLSGIAILSGGTDGEDGPTDAAGAICSEAVRDAARTAKLDPFDALAINDSYTFFAAAGGLLKTGPTNTNVMDLQVVVVHPQG